MPGEMADKKRKILIVDDEEMNRYILAQIFEKDYEILHAADGRQALEIFGANKDEIVAVLLDLIMPVMNGFDVLEILNAGRFTERVPVILITAQSDNDTTLTGFSGGAAEVINKPFDASIVDKRVRNMIEMYLSREVLKESLGTSERKLAEREKQLAQFNDRFVEAVANIVEFRDMESGQHVKRVMGFTKILADTYARLNPECGLDSETIETIVKSSALHDIGKIVIPDSILLKPDRLTDEERKVMQSHTIRGCEILERIEETQDTEHNRISREIIRSHHERYDGKGYPDGLRGDEIPISARFVSLADVYDALCSERVYKKAYDKETTYQMIIDGKCGTFDPKLLESFTQAKKVMEAFADSLSKGGGKGEFR